MSSGKPPANDWRANPGLRSNYTREWRGAGGGSSSRFSRTFKLRLVGFGLITLFFLIALLLVPMADTIPKVQLLTFGIGAYGGQTNPQGIVPVNPFGEQDASAFQLLNDRNPNQFLPLRQEVNALNGDQFLEFWGKERSSDKLARQNLIVFCTMHGWVQSTGEVKLFAIDATPENRGKLIPLKELISLLQESPARRVLLLLDTARLDSSWRLGIMSNDTAEQIASDWPPESQNRKGLANANASKVAILLAAGPGQQSWPKAGHSAFSHFLIEGLSGAADGWEKSDSVARDSGHHDQRVTLNELVAYASQRIDEWSLHRFGLKQTIQLLGETTDFDIASVSPSFSTVAEEARKLVAAEGPSKTGDAKDGVTSTEESKSGESKSAAAAPEVKWDATLASELWKTRDQLRDDPGKARPAIRRQSPLAWRAFESQLSLAEALRRGGQDKLGFVALQQANATCKRLNEQSSSSAGLTWTPNESQLIQNWGFYFDASTPTRDVVAAAGKFLMADTANADPGAKSASNGAVPANITEPTSLAIRTWLVQELQREQTAENWSRIRQIIARLPATPDLLLLRELVEPKSGDLPFESIDALRQILELRDRIRRIAVRYPEALPHVMNEIRLGLRAMNAAERWLMAADANRPEVRDWLRKCADGVTNAEQTASRYSDAIGIWSDLLCELPCIAEWIATRASDDDRRGVDWLQTIVEQWIQQGQKYRWDVRQLLSTWPEKPKRLTDWERSLLIQFVDAQRLKQAIFATAERRLSVDELAKLVNDATIHRRDFWQEFSLFFSPLELSNPSPNVWRESSRLLEQQWLPSDDRSKFEKLQSDIEVRTTASLSNGDQRKSSQPIKSAFDPLPDRNTGTSAVWQSFWSVATLSLLSPMPEDNADLWKDWERLLERSRNSAAGSSLTESERSELRKRRSEIGQKIHEKWIQHRAEASNLAAIHLSAAAQDPFLSPESNPDELIRVERQRQFAEWLKMFSDDWRSRAIKSNSVAYVSLAETAEELVKGLRRERGSSESLPKPTPNIPPRFQDVTRPTFAADRVGQLQLTVASDPDQKTATHIYLLGTRVRLKEGTALTALTPSVMRPLAAGGTFKATLKLDDNVESPQKMLVVLTESDGYPIDFQSVALHPPFDPTQWRVEFLEAKTQTPLETEPLARQPGVKVYLPPSGTIALKANLIRPEKDVTPSTKIVVYRLTDADPSLQRELIATLSDVKLTAGISKTPMVFDFPSPPKDPSSGKEPPAANASMELNRGWLFEITPDGQPSLEYLIRPTFYSAVNFISDPRPVIENDRLTLELVRPTASKPGLLPKKIPVELHVPDSFRRSLTGYTLSGSLESGQRLTLSFAMPKNWSELTRDLNSNLSLDVAGLRHAHAWRIGPIGDVTQISGQPPHIEIRLIQPAPDAKTPPRAKPVLFSGKDSLNLQFQVNATELDRTESVGDWTLKYLISRESDKGLEPTTLQNTWQLFSSLDRHVLLQNIKGGIWTFETSANDYAKETPESEIRGMSGRFQVQADLFRTDQPQSLGTAKFQFAIDDDRPPEVKVVWGTSGPRMIDKDLSFQIESSDMESGIQRIAYGFDLNGDEMFQEQKELMEEKIPDSSGIKLDNSKLTWNVKIAKAKLPKLAKDKEETKLLIVQVQNGLGIVKSRLEPVILKKPVSAAPVAKAMEGKLVLKLKVNRGAKSSVQINGPEKRTEETADDTVTFTNLMPGRYEVKVNVDYLVVGTKAVGEKSVEVKADQTTTAEITTSMTK